MNAKHTPGPWRDNSYTADGKLELACAVWTADSETPICNTGFSVGRYQAPSKEVCHANARLIAAAPDLLAALHSISLWSESRDGTPEADETALREIGNEAKAAIAKATQP